MPDADPLDDLAVRERQLIEHLLHSPEYVRQANGRLKGLLLIFGGALIFTLGEGLVYEREPKAAPAVMLAAIDLTSLVLVASLVLFCRTRRWLHRLNEAWLTPEAKKTLDGLRAEHARAEMERKG